VQAMLAKIWANRRDCSGASCVQPLPPPLQVGPQALAKLTRAQEQKVRARYGVPAL
jgi:hypothetical protein